MSVRNVNREIYETRYTAEHLRIDTVHDPHARGLIDVRLAYLDRFGRDRDVIDLGCGTGSYLLPAARSARRACGIDFSKTLLAVCRQRLIEASLKADLALADIRALPFAGRTFDLAFSYTTLYYVPEVPRAVREASRVLRAGGRFVAEFGNILSLHTLLATGTSTGVRSHLIPVAKMVASLGDAGFEIEEHRSFQVLPMLGGPWYLRPLVTPLWSKILGRKVRGRLLDEIVSSSPMLRGVAFRHMFSCVRS